MSNGVFEDYLKERLYNHIEQIEPDGWDVFLAHQRARKHRKMIYRRSLYGTAVAASVLLFLFLLPGTITPPDTAAPTISLLNPTSMRRSLDSLHVEDTEQSMVDDVRMAYLDVRKEAKVAVDVVIEKEMVMPVIEEEVQKQVVNSVSDSTEKQVAVSQLDPQQSGNNQLNIHFAYEKESEVSPRKRNNVSEGWSIAVASAYSNAAGEAPFAPVMQIMTARTRTFSTPVGLSDNQERTALSFAPPISIGINFQKELYSWLSVGVGVNYTLLQSKFSNSYNYYGENYTIRYYLHYVGLPVSALFYLVHQPKLHVYASAGGMVEKAVTAYSTFSSKYSNNSENSFVKGLQWSVYGGLGAEVLLSRMFGVYFEPGMGYFFDCKQPQSIRTVQPAQFKAEIGLRVRI